MRQLLDIFFILSMLFLFGYSLGHTMGTFAKVIATEVRSTENVR